MRNASVLPLPVGALASTSLPFRERGRERDWIGVRVVKPAFLRPERGGERCQKKDLDVLVSREVLLTTQRRIAQRQLFELLSRRISRRLIKKTNI